MFDSITRMTKEIVSILDGDVHSIWLYGSIVQDDFRLGWSDIDILVLTGKQITDNQAQELVQLRQFLVADAPGNPYYPLFEGVKQTWTSIYPEHSACWYTGALPVSGLQTVINPIRFPNMNLQGTASLFTAVMTGVFLQFLTE